MNKQEALNKIEELKSYVEGLDKKPKTVWDLKDGDEYCALYTGGVISNLWGSSCIDIGLRNQGRAFLTREEAKRESSRRETHTELERLAGGFKYVFCENMGFYIYHDGDNFDVASHGYMVTANMVYFETREACEAAIKVIGEERLNVYFDLED